ncbi:hypothetical protein [Streptomyces sp. NPDC086787]|uniref:hypothetical protein n=1 Tax=Streptomyces sp. NPDC086787 TaxID=3365759 RepID=UPI00381BDBA2
MAADHDTDGTDRTAAPREAASRTPGRVASSGPVLGRLPRPLARALAVATVPLVLHLPVPRPTDSPLPTPSDSGSPTARVSALPAQRSTVPESAPAGSAAPGPGITRADIAPASASTAPTAAHATPAPSGTPSTPPRPRPANGAWTLRAERLVLHAFSFRGTTTVHTATGTARLLKFTARSVDAVGLDLATGRGSTAMRLAAGRATTATFKGRDGSAVLTFYARELSGTVTALDGAPLPPDRAVTITPDVVPPWLEHPATRTGAVTFSGATVSQFTLPGGDLTIAGPRLRAGAR